MTSWFFDRMRSFGEADAIVFNGVAYSYAQLVRLTGDWGQFLDRHDIRAGQVVAIEGVSSVEACAGLLALIERGAVVVPMTPLPAAKRAEFLEVAEVETIISIDSEQWRRSVEITGREAGHELYERLRADGVPGLVLFSSGTTGRSKASVLDFSKVLAKYGPPTRPARTLGFLSLDHIGGINTLLHTLSQGGALVTIDERTPDTVCAAIENSRIQILPTTPTFLNMLLISRAYERYDISSLKLVTYGTEPMPEGTLTRLAKALPQVRLKQTYGLSELGIMPTKSRDDGSLWVKLGGEGFSYRIVDGILWIRSDMAMLGYLNAPAPFDEQGFFNTQDAVETDGEYVRILGRKSELINVAGEKVYPSEVENVLLELDYVADAVVSGRPSHVTGQVVKAVVKLTGPCQDQRATARAVREHCARRLEAFKVPVVVEVTEADTHSDRFKKIRSAV
ncbi:class I adenylate-forming enzyme family protein [Streptomyces antimicrobicus]|uniref:AMP-binding protein n=1 Tax=Streptomyces antimicrobicus TaxID=2883108 RepID=A0ABS8B8N1_9ACTN|nr:fatty acid--CoA ligase family protein [Streptomyces antimicrobicus]MCB5180971.1 AMP-binding protein [Streptomyces antimicrobicus]